jgi:transcriptional regulator with XRE-family HTH domain
MAESLQSLPSRDRIRAAFGRTLRDLRLRTGISQEQTALEAGVDRGYMSGLERGKHSPSLETIYRLLPVLGINFVDFAAEFDYTVSHLEELE